MTNRNRKDLPTTNASQYVQAIPRKGVIENLSEIYRVLEGSDELIVGSYPSASGSVQTFGLITFRNGLPEGIPKGASREFLDEISGAYSTAQNEVAKRGARIPAAVDTLGEALPDGRVKLGVVDSTDLILDDREHREIFDQVLSRAQDRVIIHSTFISENAQKRMQSIMTAASNRVRVDIFLGQNDDPDGGDSTSQAALKDLRTMVGESPYQDYVRLHHTSTGSHGKFLISNDRRLGWIAVVGSCNWLATKFDSFEASIRLRDKHIVAELVNSLSMMSIGRRGIWNETSQELAALSRLIKSGVEQTGRKVPVRLLYTGDHAQIPIEARDSCKRRAFVTSHRVGTAGKALTLYPLMAATANEKNDIELLAYYGRTTGALTGTGAAEIAREYAAVGLKLRPVQKPRLHAKVLGWDANSLAVSSLNWLSVDPSDKKFKEIGIFVESTRLADSFFDRFESAQWG
ncbi:phospholipase D-like domain-containing protein [Mesorhizobium sp. M1340]|uniref:phospholipase D-like domain-containing protein n=1 Tax=Mesorhizobium sp. M1340 TaxID=2957087 RepID=UPI00333D2E8A